MLKLQNIKKDYFVGDNTVEALKDIDIEFRKNEFVSILGQSGCGKTTLLNIIGGLDQYTEGDLFINGKSTKKYSDRDWDNYRNHSVGFIFQSYNLIPHQSVISNVELALTLSGVSKTERRKKAAEALEKVGLTDQMYKKPNEMSGGQMQRVTIARALVNNPEILLADEPTGALDSETSIQIMELLKEIAQDKLVIMVTHNPELAEKYSTRIIRLLDGRVTDDSMPFSSQPVVNESERKLKKPSMSFFTALSLSLNNLMTKKTRTFLTSFAGSIGIIGIALILSLSSGVDAYINKVEEDTLSNYPITIEQAGVDIGSLTTDLMSENEVKEERKLDKIYTNSITTKMMATTINGYTSNNLELFKSHIDKSADFKKYTNEVEYQYSTVMNVYDSKGFKVNPNTVLDTMLEGAEGANQMKAFANTEVWMRLFDNRDMLEKQYDVIAGHLPENYNDIVIIVDKQNQISDFTLYSLGIKDISEIKEMTAKAMKGEKVEATEETTYSYNDFLNLKFKLINNTDYFEKNHDGTWTDRSTDELYIQSKLNNAIDVNVVGILRPSEDSKINSSGFVGYTGDLMKHLINDVNNSEIVKEQKAAPEINIFTGLPFENNFDDMTYDKLMQYVESQPEEQKAQYNAYLRQMADSGLSEEQIVERFKTAMKSQTNTATYDGNLTLMGAADLNKPSAINIYPKDFEAKEKISELIDDYNKKAEKKNKITYTDYIGLMLSSITTIINAISYILIAFVSISLIVSSIMIGIITYISVLERTKEIGILRAMGASKRDVSRIFTAETLIVGFVAGAIGILVTLLLLIPINAIIKVFTDIGGLAVLPVAGAIILVAISMLLTFIAGLIPSSLAAKKDPVKALRTE